jgi:hypothetical protein
MKIPSTNLQAPEKHQTSIFNIVSHNNAWVLEFGISLELGAWNLELFPE